MFTFILLLLVLLMFFLKMNVDTCGDLKCPSFNSFQRQVVNKNDEMRLYLKEIEEELEDLRLSFYSELLIYSDMLSSVIHFQSVKY